MNNIITKSIFALLLIIEFYPIESNSQTVNDTKDCYIYNYEGEPVYGNSETQNFRQPDFQIVMEFFIDESATEKANEEFYDDNLNSAEISEYVNVEGKNFEQDGKFERSLPAEYSYSSAKDGTVQILKFVLVKY